MSDLLKLVPKAENEANEKKELLADYFEHMDEIKDDITIVLSLVYLKDGQLMVASNGVDAKTALWATEEFKMNCLFGGFFNNDEDGE